MSRSYKMVTFLAWLRSGLFPEPIGLSRLTGEVAELVSGRPGLRQDFSVDPSDRAAVREVLLEGPLHYLLNKDDGISRAVSFKDDQLRFKTPPPPDQTELLAELLREIVDYRLAWYLARPLKAVRHRFRDDTGQTINAEFQLLQSDDGYQFILESRTRQRLQGRPQHRVLPRPRARTAAPPERGGYADRSPPGHQGEARASSTCGGSNCR